MKLSKVLFFIIWAALLTEKCNYDHGGVLRRRTAKQHTIPFPLERRIRLQCKRAAQAIFTHLRYDYYFMKLETQYIILKIRDQMHDLRSFIMAGKSKDGSLLLPPLTFPDQSYTHEHYASLFDELTPHDRKMAEQLQSKWIEDSTKFNNFFVKAIKKQSEEWESLIVNWNTPLQLPEDQQPYRYQPDNRDRKLVRLFLRDDVRLMSRDVHRLYQRQYSQIMNLKFHSFSEKLSADNSSTDYSPINFFLNSLRENSLYQTKLYMLDKLYTTRVSVDRQLKHSNDALYQSIHIERGQYYAVLHPDNEYIIRIRPTEYRVLSKMMRRIWIDAPINIITRSKTMDYWIPLARLLQKLRSWVARLSTSLLKKRRQLLTKLAQSCLILFRQFIRR